MKCSECEGLDFEINDRLGEHVCVNCGYVQVSNIFEETSRTIVTTEHHYNFGAGMYMQEADRTLGSFIGEGETNNRTLLSLKRTQRRFRDKKNVSINKGLLECNMVLSPYLPNVRLKDSVHSYYRKLYLDNRFTGIPLTLRACGIVIICLREYGLPISINEIAEKNSEDAHKISKCARHFARYLGKSHILQNMPISSWIDRVCNDLDASRDFTSDCRLVVEYLHQLITANDIHFSRSYMATGVWITSILRKQGRPEFTQQEICDVCNCSAVAQRVVSKKVFPMLNIKKNNLNTLTVKEFVSGIRNGGI